MGLTLAQKRERLVRRVLEGMGHLPVEGERYVIGRTRSGRAVCLHWVSGNMLRSEENLVSGAVLRAMFEEVAALGLKRPPIIYGTHTSIGGTRSFQFRQFGTDAPLDWTK